MSEKPLADEALHEQLVAYLDGELDAEECRRVEDLLASDAQARQVLNELQRSWRLLDELGASSVDDAFTRTTLQMAVQAAAEEVKTQQAELPRRRRTRLLAISGALVAAAGMGFVAMALTRTDPDRELLQNLPVVENLDQYLQVGDIDFVRQLHEQGLFLDESNEEPTANGKTND